MRTSRLAALSLSSLLFACGGEVSSSDDGQHAAGADAGVDTGTATSTAIVARAFVETELSTIGWAGYFEVDIQPAPAPSPYCAGATQTVGSCCYFAPSPPPPTQVGGSGGSAVPEESVGTMTLTEATSTLGTFSYVSGGYAHVPSTYGGTPWTPGDLLGLSATGGDIPAFSVSSPVLVTPDVVIASTVSRSESLELSWTPDGNARSMTFQILDGIGAVVACSSVDSAGSVVVDGSLIAEFSSGAQLEISATRSGSRLAQTGSGQVELETLADQLLQTHVQ
jgi:hypothetical protein